MNGTEEIVRHLAEYLNTRYKPSLEQHGGANAKFLLLHCIDYRYPKAIHEALDQILPGRYDQVVLAGAALAGVIDFGKDPKPHWSQTLLEHVGLSMTLPHHEIKSILVLEHCTCGAYKKFELLGENPTPEEEQAVHAHQAQRFADLVASTFPKGNLYFASYLLDAAPEKAMRENRPIITDLYQSAL